jgi:hypothetical protein
MEAVGERREEKCGEEDKLLPLVAYDGTFSEFLRQGYSAVSYPTVSARINEFKVVSKPVNKTTLHIFGSRCFPTFPQLSKRNKPSLQNLFLLFVSNTVAKR